MRFTRSLEAGRALSGNELGVLAEKLASASDEGEALRLREEIAAGFYGTK